MSLNERPAPDFASARSVASTGSTAVSPDGRRTVPSGVDDLERARGAAERDRRRRAAAEVAVVVLVAVPAAAPPRGRVDERAGALDERVVDLRLQLCLRAHVGAGRQGDRDDGDGCSRDRREADAQTHGSRST